jgi:hypothetical protein
MKKTIQSTKAAAIYLRDYIPELGDGFGDRCIQRRTGMFIGR